ncbi:MAG TPA: apolipoprotein N-acyltransferase, partial [Mycobacteriales bacterium]|nr:apolipoprotein N-acyltransferase [Mycobacteriales bacterium]
TSVPWDQLGYSQIDNALVNQLAPWTGVYGITFLLVGANALLAGALLSPGKQAKLWSGAAGALLAVGGSAGLLLTPPRQAAVATAVLVQPNLDVGSDSAWFAPGEWASHIAEFTRLANDECKSYIAGIPQTGAPTGEVVCPPYPTHPDLVVWPESPAPFVQSDPRFQQAVAAVARSTDAPLIVGGIGTDYTADDHSWIDFNSAIIVSADDTPIGRYDKIHLVPFGEYVPYRNLLFFARKLTGRVSEFTRGAHTRIFVLPTQTIGHRRYGIFICYEAVFANEVRQFVRIGAQVLVNISDDGWYGDTSAPWQHLNMVRMRAVENRRWILRDTNNGVTAVIDPYGRVRQSIPRHQIDALPAQYSFRDDITFYTAHGDVFAWGCAILAIGMMLWVLYLRVFLKVHIKVRS